ncbi:MAG: VCBS repeat-containing protein [Labilithrix sp.]|nr:VCBS repeat-containing protein [Labilithrix sp.]
MTSSLSHSAMKLTVLFAIAAGCGETEESSLQVSTDARTAVAKQQLWTDGTASLWTQSGNTVRMCWHEMVNVPTSQQTPLKNFIIDRIRTTWETAANITVTWTDPCPSGLNPDDLSTHVGVKIVWSAPDTFRGNAPLALNGLTNARQRSVIGNKCTTNASCGPQNLCYKTDGSSANNPDTEGVCDPQRMRLSVGSNWNVSDSTRLDLQSLVLHEFGHVLGFSHEFDRPNGSPPADCGEIPQQYGGQPGVQLGPYDPYSIMNAGYCASSSSWLTPLDMAGARAAYGARAVTPMPCRTAPVRGAAATTPTARVDVAGAWKKTIPATQSAPFTGTVTEIAVSPSSKTAFPYWAQWAPTSVARPWNNTSRWVAGDFDGDNITDLAAIWNDNGLNTITVFSSTSGSFVRSDWAVRSVGYMDTTQWLPGDFDRDGFDDLVAVWNDRGSATFTFFRSVFAPDPATGVWSRRFASPVHWNIQAGGFPSTGNANYLSADMDRDGYSDIVIVWNDGGSNTITVWRSLGSSFAQRHWAIRWLGYMSTTRWLAGDFNNDKSPDIAAIWNDRGDITYTVYPGNRSNLLWPSHWSIRSGTWRDENVFLAGDFNGDGRDDLLSIWNYGGSNALTVRRTATAPGGGNLLIAEHWALNQGGWVSGVDATQWCAGNFAP